MKAKSIAPHTISRLRPGRIVLDCSGPIHREWLREALFERGLKVLVYRRCFESDQMNELPVHADLQMASGELEVVLHRMKDAVNLIVDDLGSLHFHERPLELLREYYEALAWGGEAWIRFPKTFFVFLEGGRRVSLQEYLASKYPLIVKRLRSSEIDRSLLSGASSGDDWILIRKDRGYPKLFFSIHPRTMGGTSVPNGGAHAAYLEFVERAPMKKSGWFRRAA